MDHTQRETPRPDNPAINTKDKLGAAATDIENQGLRRNRVEGANDSPGCIEAFCISIDNLKRQSGRFTNLIGKVLAVDGLTKGCRADGPDLLYPRILADYGKFSKHG